MPYWGNKPEDNDFAFDTVGSIIYLIKERMKSDVEVVLAKKYPEQGMVASMVCLRLLGERFPKNLKVHFGKRDFVFVKTKFEEWYAAVSPLLPSDRRDAILAEAEHEFALFQERFFSNSN